MCVAQGVSPGAKNPTSRPVPPRLPPSLTAEDEEGRLMCVLDPRANALGYTHAAPPGLRA